MSKNLKIGMILMILLIAIVGLITLATFNSGNPIWIIGFIVFGMLSTVTFLYYKDYKEPGFLKRINW